MAEPINENLLKAIRLTREMSALADEGDRDRNDDSCGIIYGILRDTAYRLRQLAENECEQHRAAGKWDEESDLADDSDENENTDSKGDNQCQL